MNPIPALLRARSAVVDGRNLTAALQLDPDWLAAELAVAAVARAPCVHAWLVELLKTLTGSDRALVEKNLTTLGVSCCSAHGVEAVGLINLAIMRARKVGYR